MMIRFEVEKATRKDSHEKYDNDKELILVDAKDLVPVE